MALNLNQNPNQGQTNVPPPPVPEVAVRTMQSDVRSINAGDARPAPEVVQAPNIGGGQEPKFIPETDNKLKTPVGGGKKSKGMLWAIVGVIAFAGIGAAGYFYVYPLITGGDAVPVPPVQTTPIAETPTTPPPAATPHLSLFVLEPAKTMMVEIAGSVNQSSIMEAMLTAGVGMADNTLVELVFTDEDASQITFPMFLMALLPDFGGTNQVAAAFSNDFTAYLYKDAKGIWPGYVAQVKTGVPDATIKSWLTMLEGANLADFFLANPGTFMAFKDGMLNGFPDRYAVGSNPGASFAHAMINGQVIIATSYPGMQEAFRLLGL